MMSVAGSRVRHFYKSYLSGHAEVSETLIVGGMHWVYSKLCFPGLAAGLAASVRKLR